MSEWVLDEFMEAWQAIQRGEVTGDIQVVMSALDAGNRKIFSSEYENKKKIEQLRVLLKPFADEYNEYMKQFWDSEYEENELDEGYFSVKTIHLKEVAQALEAELIE